MGFEFPAFLVNDEIKEAIRDMLFNGKMEKHLKEKGVWVPCRCDNPKRHIHFTVDDGAVLTIEDS